MLAVVRSSLVPRPIPLKSHRSGVFSDVRITSDGRDLSECADLSDRAGRTPACTARSCVTCNIISMELTDTSTRVQYIHKPMT